MIKTGSLANYTNSIFDMTISADSPHSGFEVSLMETGAFYSPNLITFSGREGYLFDKDGNFFGGYESGVPFNIQVHYDYDNSTFSYYHQDNLIANGLSITGVDSQGATDGAVNFVKFTKHGNSNMTVSATGIVQDSLAKHGTSQVDSRITSTMDVATNGSMFTSFTDPNGTLEGGGFNASRSTDFWAKDIDFTSVSVWNNRGFGSPADFRMRGATAITKRHIIMAKHFKLSASDVVYFVDADGTWVSRTVSAIADHGSADITVGVLNADLPDNISFAKVLPSNVNDFLKMNSVGAIDQYYRPIVVGFDFEKKLTLMVLTYMLSSSNNSTYIATPASIPDPYDNLGEALVSGDSGNPVFIIIGGEAVLITSYKTTTNGPSYAGYISAINTLIASADSSAGVSTGFTLTEFDLGSFDFQVF
tara:strand:- start:4410 stop:5666 length:1257 start_codon:yes stop_codon:yes gene_type:complete